MSFDRSVARSILYGTTVRLWGNSSGPSQTRLDRIIPHFSCSSISDGSNCRRYLLANKSSSASGNMFVHAPVVVTFPRKEKISEKTKTRNLFKGKPCRLTALCLPLLLLCPTAGERTALPLLLLVPPGSTSTFLGVSVSANVPAASNGIAVIDVSIVVVFATALPLSNSCQQWRTDAYWQARTCVRGLPTNNIY